MNKSFSQYLEELKKLSLPKGKYAIFGSGPLAIRKLRDTHDLDVIVKNDVYKDLCSKYPSQIKTEPVNCIQIGNLEIGNEWLNDSSQIDEMIDDAEIIDGFPFVKLRYVLAWKKEMGREKDLKDVQLINEYLKKSRQQK